MGTKRHLAPTVRAIIDDLKPTGSVVDLFSGMGSVAEALASEWPVVSNDILKFTTAVGRARFLAPGIAFSPHDVADELRSTFREHAHDLRRRYRHQLAREAAVLDGTPEQMAHYMADAIHVGNSPSRAQTARRAAQSQDPSDHYRLALLYFSAGYFSARQAIELDAIRRAIDVNLRGVQYDRAIAAWLAVASTVINAPGHAAQYLRPNSLAISKRIQANWRRSVWDCFRERLCDVQPVGTTSWRSLNCVSNREAIDFFDNPPVQNIGVVYADPPYTKDQYTRYYHVYETLFLYDFPDSQGVGRYREDRYSTGFSMSRFVGASFRRLCQNVSDLGVPLVLSYPGNGLLQRSGDDLIGILRDRFQTVEVLAIDSSHSTLGASSGASKKATVELIHVCRN